MELRQYLSLNVYFPSFMSFVQNKERETSKFYYYRGTINIVSKLTLRYPHRTNHYPKMQYITIV